MQIAPMHKKEITNEENNSVTILDLYNFGKGNQIPKHPLLF